MSSNLADLSLDLLADLPPVLTSCGQDEFKFGRSIPRSASRSPLVLFRGAEHNGKVVKMSSNLADLPLDLLADGGQDEFKFGRSPLDLADLVAKFGRSTLDLPADVPPYSHLVVQEWQFQVSIVTDHISRSTGRSIPSTDILWSRWPFHS